MLLVDDALDSRRGSRLLALSEPQEREPRLRLMAVLTRLSIRGIGVGKLTLQPVELGALVGSSSEDHVRLRCAGGRQVELGQRFGPSAAQLHDLRAVHQTLPAIPNERRLERAPSGQSFGPLARPPNVEDAVARLDHRAVDDSRHVGRHLAGRN